MAVLVTRPHPDDEATAAALRARGFAVLRAPMLRFEPVAFHDELDANYGAVIVTSANALRGIEPHLAGSRLAQAAAVRGRRTYRRRCARRRIRQCDLGSGDAAGLRDLGAGQRQGQATEESQPAAVSGRRRSGARSGRRTRRTRFYRRHPHDLPDGPGVEPAARSLRRVRGQPDRGGAALFAAQRARIPGGGAGGRRRNLGAGDPAMLHFRRPSPRLSATPGPRRSWWRGSPDENALFEALDRALRP